VPDARSLVGVIMDALSVEIGRALRRVRQSRGLTLHNVAEVSEGVFKATSVAGYERGERTITLERFIRLSALYGVRPERLLADILRSVEGRQEPTVDLTVLESLGSMESALVSAFVQQVRSLRKGEEQEAEMTIVLRTGDLESLAKAAGKSPEELVEILRPVLRRKG
jgi:transcriptional regulator with XRE-family HTH domain